MGLFWDSRWARRVEDKIDRIDETVSRILDRLRRTDAVRLNVTLGPSIPEAESFPEENDMSLVTSQTAGNKCLVTLHPADSNNQPAAIDQTDHPVQVTSSDPTIVEVSDVAADGLSFQLHFRSAGSAQVSIDVDADLDPGELRELIDTIDVTVVPPHAPEAATLGITIGASVPEADPLP